MNGDNTFDFIIVGAGSAGCVLANRLSADRRFTVLLIEAGKVSHPLTPVPMSYSKLIVNPKVNWCYASEPEPMMAERSIPVPRGRLLGGSSAINGLVYVRGQPMDYDAWAQLGNRGWSFDDILPIFQRIENYESGADEWRRQGGPLHISEVTDQNPLYDALLGAGEEVGLPNNPDYNGADQMGICRTQTTIRDGRRISTAVAYLAPARSRPNLEIVTDALVHRLTLEGKRCTGISYSVGGRPVDVQARTEVIVCCGTINSPQLLELSGIGQPALLESHGIEVRHVLPGVGESLRDHIAPRMGWTVSERGVTFNDRARGLGLLWQVLRYAIRKDGFLSLPSAPLLAFIKTRADLERPDAQLHLVPYTFSPTKRQLLDEPGMTITVYQLRPESLGSIHIKSADPSEAPAIRFSFLSDPLDRQTLVDAVRFARHLMQAAAMDRFRGIEFKPGSDVQSDADIIEWIGKTAETAYHPIGTCRMGSDDNAVVNDQLLVHGIEGLRIADGSIMPTLISGNTNAACIMIGEKAADMVLAEHR